MCLNTIDILHNKRGTSSRLSISGTVLASIPAAAWYVALHSHQFGLLGCVITVAADGSHRYTRHPNSPGEMANDGF
jgi:hypothetical protein